MGTLLVMNCLTLIALSREARAPSMILGLTVLYWYRLTQAARRKGALKIQSTGEP